MSQTKDILNWLQTGASLDAMQALTEFGCFRLAARIKDIREMGVPVRTTSVKTPNGKSVAQYSLNYADSPIQTEMMGLEIKGGKFGGD